MGGDTPLDPENDVLRLCPELRAIAHAELARGNSVAEASRWGDYFIVWLTLPFHRRYAPLPPGVLFREPNDPHYWKSEYVHEPTKHVLACRF